MELYFLRNECMVNFSLLLETTKYMLTSVIEVLALASGLEIKFVDGTLGRSATQMKHFSSGSLSATNVSQAEHKCHQSRILKYHFQKQYTGKYGKSFTSVFLYLQVQVKFLNSCKVYKTTSQQSFRFSELCRVLDCAGSIIHHNSADSCIKKAYFFLFFFSVLLHFKMDFS